MSFRAVFRVLVCLLCWGSLRSDALTLGEALNAPNLEWSTSADLPWLVDTNVTHDGEAAASSGALAVGQSNWIQTSVTGPAALKFWWRVSSAINGPSYLQLEYNGISQMRLQGGNPWQQRCVYVPPGPQTIRWFYDQKATYYEACAWVDQVSVSEVTAPEITAQPTNTTVSAGDAVTLSVAVAGPEPFSFQWFKDGAALNGATSSSWTTSNAQSPAAGGYSVVITNAVGSVTSQVGTLTVVPSAPEFTSNPLSQGAAPGATVVLKAAAMGTEPMAGWQWYFNGVPVAGSNAASFTIRNVQPACFGAYSVSVTNSAGVTTSAVATLGHSPVIRFTSGNELFSAGVVPLDATNVMALAGGDHHCLALRADGTVVQWGWPLPQVPDAATNIQTIAAGSAHSIAAASNGTVLLWGSPGMVPTNPPANATNLVRVAQGAGAQHLLTLRADGTLLGWSYPGRIPNAPPAATNIVDIAAGAFHAAALRADGTVLSWGNNYYSSTNVPLAATNIVAIAAGWYHTLALRDDGRLLTWGNGFGTVAPIINDIVAIACSGEDALAVRADGKFFAWGRNNPSIPPWATNIVGVGGASYEGLALVGEGPPHIIGKVIDRSVVEGGRVYFRAEAVGALPLRFQWFLDGQPLPGQTNRVLKLMDVPLTSAGDYSVTVTNALGLTTSGPARLTVLAKQARFVQMTHSGGDQLTLTAAGPTGLAWKLQTSADLQGWSDVATLTNEIGTMTFQTARPNSTQQYYRLRLVP